MHSHFQTRDWEPHIADFVRNQLTGVDAAHDYLHIQRVVANTLMLAQSEQADVAVVVPAAWLHDCVVIAKDSPLRPMASRLAAQKAIEFLATIAYPEQYLAAIAHAIEAHSFSAAIQPRTIEARVVQDADRLDALGAIGIARCFTTGGSVGQRLYDPHQPIPTQREPNDSINILDHFYRKLLKLPEQMTTPSGRAEAQRRITFMRQFLAQFEHELQWGRSGSSSA